MSVSLTSDLPWAGLKISDRVMVIIKNLSTRLNFGPGGLYQGRRLGGDAGQAYIRLIVAAALCMDNSMLVMGADRYKQLAGKDGSAIIQELQKSGIFSVFVEGVGGLTGIAENDLGSIFFDHVTRDAIRAEVTKEIQFLPSATAPPVPLTDRWFLRPVPGTLFEFRFLRWEDHHIVHISTSAAQLNTLVPRIVRDLGVYLHLASIDRRCLLSPGQEEIIKKEPAIVPDVLGEWASRNYFFMDPEVLVTPLSAQVRETINPSEWEVPSPDRDEEWSLIREGYRKAAIAQFSGYNTSLFSLGKALVELRESSAGAEIPAPYPSIMVERANELATEHIAQFIRSTGAWVEEYVSEGTGSKLNLLTIAERMLANHPHTDSSGAQSIGYIGYLDKIYDCFTRASLHGIYEDVDPHQHVVAILDHFAELLKHEPPEELAKKPFSEVWVRLLKDKTSLPQRTSTLGKSTRAGRRLRFQIFGHLLLHVGGIQEYLPSYFQNRKLPPTEGWGPINWWRFLLEIEFLLNEYLNQEVSLKNRVTLDRFAARKTAAYFPSGSLCSLNKVLVSSYSSWKAGEGADFAKKLTKVQKKSKKTNQDELVLALEAGDWGNATRCLMTELESAIRNTVKKEKVGEILENATA